jgi:hypothetical protein
MILFAVILYFLLLVLIIKTLFDYYGRINVRSIIIIAIFIFFSGVLLYFLTSVDFKKSDEIISKKKDHEIILPAKKCDTIVIYDLEGKSRSENINNQKCDSLNFLLDCCRNRLDSILINYKILLDSNADLNKNWKELNDTLIKLREGNSFLSNSVFDCNKSYSILNSQLDSLKKYVFPIESSHAFNEFKLKYSTTWPRASISKKIKSKMTVSNLVAKKIDKYFKSVEDSVFWYCKYKDGRETRKKFPSYVSSSEVFSYFILGTGDCSAWYFYLPDTICYDTPKRAREYTSNHGKIVDIGYVGKNEIRFSIINN